MHASDFANRIMTILASIKWVTWRYLSRYPVQSSTSQRAKLPMPHLGDGEPSRRIGPPQIAVITKTKPQTKCPSLYCVLLLNDNSTPMEFVVQVLERFFNKDSDTAQAIMMRVQQHGIGECGIYTYEVAETKVIQVREFARKYKHPLQCVMQKT